MTSEQFIQLIRARAASINRMARDTLPVLAGNIAKRHIDNDFRLGGFTNDGFTPWKPTARQTRGRGAQADYGPLLCIQGTPNAGRRCTADVR